MAIRRLIEIIFVCFFTHCCLYAQIPMRDWSTYHGGTNEDSFRDMAIDASGNVYVVGSTRSSNAISTPAAYQSVIAGGSDVFVAKYDTDGNRIWSTYFGGTGDDFGQSIDLDINGNIFITGLTFSNDGIATAGTHQTSFNGNGDAFIAKLDNNGFRIWGSYFGGSGFDFANDLEVDIMGNPIIIGWTNSNNNISSPGSFQTTYGAQDDILLAKFSTNGQLLWATYYGDAGFDTGLQVESDGMANIIISGWTSSLVNMTTSGAFQTTYGGNTSDNFIAKFDQAGNRLWATYYGGNGDDYADALLVNAAGDIYLSGSTNSPNNIATAGSFQPSVSTGYDVFLARLTANGGRTWATYFGGNGDDTAYRLRQGNDGAIYMVGYTLSTDRMATAGAFQINKSSGRDAFISRFEDSGLLSWSSYYGGNANDFGYGLVVDGNDHLFVNGYTEGSNNLSATGTTAQLNYGGGTKDGFISKFAPCTAPMLNFGNSGFACGPVDYVFEFGLAGQPPFTIYYSIDGISQTPWITNNSNFFPTVDANLWTKIIQIDSVKSGSCKGVVNSVWGFVQVRDSIQATQPVILCDPLTSTYTVTVDLSGGAFGDFSTVGPNGGFINSVTDRFVSTAIPFNDPYFVLFTESGTFSNCDTISFQGVSGCMIPCGTAFGQVSNGGPYCPGSSAALNASGATSYQWSGPNGFTSTLQNPVINNVNSTNAGLYIVTVTDGNNCTATLSTTVIVNAAPNVTASSNGPICAGSVLNLMSSGGASYQWSGPNSFTSNLQNPTITNVNTTNAGVYMVTVTNGNNCTATLSTTVMVNSAPNVTASSNGPICAGSVLNLMSSGGASYQWSGPNGFTSSLQNPVITNVSNQNQGSYIVTVTNANGCTSSSSVLLSINSAPLALLSSNSPVCNGGDISFQLSGGTSYIWQGPNGFVSTLQNPTISNVTSLNSGTYSVTVTGQNSCTTAVSTIVNVIGQLNVAASSNSPVCQGDTIKLTANGGTSYIWSGPNGFNATSQNPVIPLANSNTNGTYILTVSDVSGCTGTRMVNVLIQNKPIVIINGDQQICQGDTVNLTTPSSGSLLWSTGSSATMITASPSVNTLYSLLVEDNGCKDSASYEVIVRSSPNLTLLPTTSTISTGQSVQLNVSGADEYIWTPSFGLTCADCPDPIATPIVTTTYCVEGRIDGCVADTCLLVTVQETCALVFSNVFSPDGDGSNDSWCSLAYDCISNQSLFIYDRWGNLIHSQTGIDVCWDGTKNGTKLQTNVYTYLLQITKTDGLKENRSGSITLVN